MGTASSSLAGSELCAWNLCSLEDVPENCLTVMFMYMEPPEICLLAKVNRSFHRASRSDNVWEHKLPHNYKFLVRRILEDDQQKGEKDKHISRKKEIYARLCRPNLFDAGTKEAWLDKRSGKVSLAISPKAMKITGIDDRRYWEYISSDESRFGSVACEDSKLRTDEIIKGITPSFVVLNRYLPPNYLLQGSTHQGLPVSSYPRDLAPEGLITLSPSDNL